MTSVSLFLTLTTVRTDRTVGSRNRLGKKLDGDSRAVDMHIAQIRKKLGADLAAQL